MTPPPVLLLLDPDANRRQGLATALAAHERFLVRQAEDLPAAWAILAARPSAPVSPPPPATAGETAATRAPVAVAISEARLPQGSGLRLREPPGWAGMPLLLLDDASCRPAGMDLPTGVGWLGRPFRFQALLETLATLMAPPSPAPLASAPLASALVAAGDGESRVSLGAAWLQPERRQVCDAAGRPLLRLTEKEAAILACLAAAPGVAVGREALLAAVWGYRTTVDTHTLATHIYRLRRKLAACHPVLGAGLITTAEGYGWQTPLSPFLSFS